VTADDGLGVVTVSLGREQLNQAKDAFASFRWEQSRAHYAEARRAAEAVLATNEDATEATRVLSVALLGEAASLLNLQNIEGAKTLLDRIVESMLDVRQRSAFARALVQVDRVEKAAAVLAAVPESEQNEEQWREARQVVEFAQGRVPSSPMRTASVLNQLTNHYLHGGEVARAASAAVEGISLENENPILRANLIAAAMICLLRTLFEDDLRDEGVPVASRRELAQRIVAAVQAVFTSQLPRPVRTTFLSVAVNYAASLREIELLKFIDANSSPAERDDVEAHQHGIAFELAAKGDLAAALDRLPRQDHPWRTELIRCSILRTAGDRASAISGLESLNRAWPGRMPINLALAELLMDRGNFAGALASAEICYRAFPSDSMCFKLARCLIETGDGRRALEILEPATTSEHAVELRANAADVAGDPRAASYWAKLLSYDSAYTYAQLRLAYALARSGDVSGAATQAGKLLEERADTLAPNEITACGELLLLARFLPNTERLIRLAAEKLRERFSDDDNAEFQRFRLLSALGFPPGIPPIDYGRLAKSGHVKSLSLDEAVDWIGQRRDLGVAAHHLYREGWLSAESLCELTGLRAANLVASAVQYATKGGPAPLRAPVTVGLTAKAIQVAGGEFLCGSVELLLLGHCGVLREIAPIIQDGALLATKRTWSRMVADAYHLEHSAQRHEAARLGQLRQKIGLSHHIVRLDEAGDERAAAAAHSLRFLAVDPQNLGDHDVLALVQSVRRAGNISKTKFEGAARYLGRPNVHLEPLDVDGRPFLLEAGLIELLDGAEVLDAILNATSKMFVTERGLRLLSDRVEELELAGIAATLQRETVEQLGDGLRRGWFRVVPDPDESPLPPVKETSEPARAEVFTHSIRGLVALKDILVRNPGWLRISADSYGIDSLGHPPQWHTFAFKDEKEARAFVGRYWIRSDREDTVSRFVRAVLKDASHRTRALRWLAQLGFADALLPDDVVQLVLDFGRVDVGVGAQILDGMEASVGDALARGVLSRMQVAMVYAGTLWRLASERLSHGAGDVSVNRQVLDRLERLDLQHSTRLVEQMLCNLVIHALDDREASFAASEDGMYRLVRESFAGQLWADIAGWEAVDARRQAACRRAVAHAWEILGDLQDGPTKAIQWAPIGLATDVLIQSRGVDSHVSSPDAVVAVLSALWKERPLRDKQIVFSLATAEVSVALEDILQAAAQAAVERPAELSSDGTSITFDYAPAGTQGGIEVSVPIEAAILRMDAPNAAGAATRLAIEVGVRDGRLCQALLEFAKYPQDPARRKYLARTACAAPFRLVADDPRFLLYFGDRSAARQQGYPATLDELREMLSEPATFLHSPVGVAERELPAEFQRRVADGGEWSARLDQDRLIHFASRVPGRLMATAARSFFEGRAAQQDREEQLRHVLSVLRNSRDSTIGSVGLAMAFATFGCLSDADESLRGELASALAKTLELEFFASGDGVRPTIAAVEDAALQRVGTVVTRLAVRGLGEAEHAFLTHRLYEWWREVHDRDVLGMLKKSEPSTWHLVRAEVLLNVVLDILELEFLFHHRSLTALAPLVPALVAISAQHGDNPFAPAPRPRGWLYWQRPQGCGWLAANIAVWVEPKRFFELPAPIRLAVLEKLPRTAADAGQHAISFQSVFRALGAGIQDLTDPEVELLRKWTETAESHGVLPLWKAGVLFELVRAFGEPASAKQFLDLVELPSLHVARSDLIVGYVEAVALSNRRDLALTLVDLFETTRRSGAEDTFGDGLSRALQGRAQVVVRELLGRVHTAAATPTRLSQLIGALLNDNLDHAEST